MKTASWRLNASFFRTQRRKHNRNSRVEASPLWVSARWSTVYATAADAARLPSTAAVPASSSERHVLQSSLSSPDQYQCRCQFTMQTSEMYYAHPMQSGSGYPAISHHWQATPIQRSHNMMIGQSGSMIHGLPLRLLALLLHIYCLSQPLMMMQIALITTRLLELPRREKPSFSYND